MLTFLHLSDIHFTTEDADSQFDRDNEIREALLDDLGVQGRSDFDAILITGDIAYHGLKDEFDRASRWFDQIREKTNVPAELLFSVPGNHDIDQNQVKEDSLLWDGHKTIRGIRDKNRLDSELRKKLKDTSWDFLKPLEAYKNFAAEQGNLSTTLAHELAWSYQLTSMLEGETSVKLHGLNSALISDGGDQRGNLLISPFQFGKLSASRETVNVVLCHHPTSWLMDGNNVDDRFRKHAHIVLTGHEHESRCMAVDNGVRICAGAVHPSRGESEWNPGYNVIRLSVSQESENCVLKIEVETRVWDKTDFCFCSSPGAKGQASFEHCQELPEAKFAASSEKLETSEFNATILPQASLANTNSSPDNAAFAANRRKLIVRFFRIGIIARLEAAMEAGAWEDRDDSLEGQARWARVFERAEANGKLGALWNAVAMRDQTLAETTNPFIK